MPGAVGRKSGSPSLSGRGSGGGSGRPKWRESHPHPVGLPGRERARTTAALSLILVFAVMAACAQRIEACSVPVFRYALERWPAEPYEVLVFHRGAFSAEDAAVVDWLGKIAIGGEGYANVDVRSVDLDNELDARTLTFWKSLVPPPSQGGGQGEGRDVRSGVSPTLTPPLSLEGRGRREPVLPWVAVRYPEMFRIPVPAWSGPLSASAVRALFDSPARREIGRRILKGETAVWVLLECGQREKDEAAARLLTTELDKIEKTLELPELLPEDILGDVVQDVDIKLAFSLVRLSRKDPAEKAFVEMLLGSEPDLKTFSEPMVFPVFGQGRSLGALVGRGINPQNIGEISVFLAGPCSCIVKDQNPGVDLLMSVNWDALPGGAWVKPPELPPLTGIPQVTPEVPEADTPRKTAGDRLRDSGLGVLGVSLLGVAALGILVVVVASSVIKRRRGAGEE